MCCVRVEVIVFVVVWEYYRCCADILFRPLKGFGTGFVFSVSSTNKKSIFTGELFLYTLQVCLHVYVYIQGMFMWMVFLLMPSCCLWARASVSPNWRSIFIWAFLQTTSLAWSRQNTDFHCTPIKSECLSCFSLALPDLHLHATVHLYCAKAKERSLIACCIVQYILNTLLCVWF